MQKKESSINYSLLLRQMIHVLPVTPSRKRKKNFRAIYKVNWGDLKALQVTARETLNTFDLLTLLSLTKAIIESELKDGGVWKDPDGEERNMYVFDVGTRRFVERYRGLRWGSRNYEAVKQSFERLTDCTWTYCYIDGLSRVKILLDFQERGGKWAFWVSKNFADAAKKREDFLKVNMSYIRSCKTDLGKLLLVWLQGQKNTACQEELISQALHLSCTQKKKTRYELKTAFANAVACGYLRDFTLVKRNSHYQFCWTHSTRNLANRHSKHGA